jgi:CBS domain-containing protein
MVTSVITIDPDLTVKAAANTLVRNRISAVPVVTCEGQLVGILSEGDLIRRVETGTDRQRSGWLDLLYSSETLATEFVRSHGHKVSDLMTRDVVVATPETSLREIANLLEKHGIKRVPIVENDRVVGVVSRADLLRAMASAPDAPETSAPDTADQKLRTDILSRLHAQTWAHPSQINVVVQDATVQLWGFVQSEAEHKAVRILAEETPGVRAINDYLGYRPMQSAL